MKSNFSLAIIALLLLTSCEERPIKPGSMYNNELTLNQTTSHIRYFYDEVGDKCFAERGLGNSYTFTCVPCDSAVLNAIKYEYHGK